MNFFQSIGEGLGRLSRNINHFLDGKLSPDMEAQITAIVQGAAKTAVSTLVQDAVNGKPITLAELAVSERDYLNSFLGDATDPYSVRGQLLTAVDTYEQAALAAVVNGTTPVALDTYLTPIVAKVIPKYADTLVGIVTMGVDTAALAKGGVRAITQFADQAKARITGARF